MNFLSSVVGSLTGTSIPYSFGEEQQHDGAFPRSVWRVFEGIRKEVGTPCTIFQRDKNGAEEDQLALNALRKLRAMRLPGVLKVLDTYEMDSTLYIVTERVVPLIDVLKTVEASTEMLTLVVYSVAKAIRFVNVEGSSVLGQVGLNTVYVTQAGVVKLGGFELCNNMNSDPAQPLYRSSQSMPGFEDYCPPEVIEKGVDVLRGKLAYKLDGYRLGVFIFRLFNGYEYHIDVNSLTQGKHIPRALGGKNFQKLVSSSPTTRYTVEQYIDQVSSQAFDTSSLINIYDHLDEITLKSEEEKIRLFESLEAVKDDALPGFFEYRIIPELAQFFNHAPAQAALALKYILSYSETLPKEPFSKLVKPIIIKAFAVPDRQVRMLLLGFLPKYVVNLDKSDVSDKLFTSFVTGFSDSNATIREESVKGVLYLAPKLADRQLNNELLRFLAKTQSDENEQVRTSTTICLGKIAEHLNRSSRPTVLATAFAKALKDPCLQSRLAGIMALLQCIEFFTPDVIANKILTVIAPSLLDKSSKVRGQAQIAFDTFFQKIKEESLKLSMDKDDDADTLDEVSKNVQNFGINLSGAFAQLTTGLGGSLNNEVNKLTPEGSGASTPRVVEVSQRNVLPPVRFEQKPKVVDSSWDNDIDIDNDGWGIDDTPDASTASIYKPKQPKMMAPKVIGLATEDKVKPRVGVTAKKGMQLKKSKLKLELEHDENDGWGDGW